MEKLCKNITTGLIFWWNENLKNDPEIVILSPEEAKKVLGKKKVSEEPKQKEEVEEKAEKLLR